MSMRIKKGLFGNSFVKREKKWVESFQLADSVQPKRVGLEAGKFALELFIYSRINIRKGFLKLFSTELKSRRLR